MYNCYLCMKFANDYNACCCTSLQTMGQVHAASQSNEFDGKHAINKLGKRNKRLKKMNVPGASINKKEHSFYQYQGDDDCPRHYHKAYY